MSSPALAATICSAAHKRDKLDGDGILQADWLNALDTFFLRLLLSPKSRTTLNTTSSGVCSMPWMEKHISQAPNTDAPRLATLNARPRCGCVHSGIRSWHAVVALLHTLPPSLIDNTSIPHPHPHQRTTTHTVRGHHTLAARWRRH